MTQTRLRLPRSYRLARGALVICAASLILLWVASIPASYFVYLSNSLYVRLEAGEINCQHDSSIVIHNGRYGVAPRTVGMQWAPDFSFPARGGWHVRLPLWIPTLILAGPAAAMFIIPRLRRPPGSCRRCGYLLSGLQPTDEGAIRCPECFALNKRNTDAARPS